MLGLTLPVFFPSMLTTAQPRDASDLRPSYSTKSRAISRNCSRAAKSSTISLAKNIGIRQPLPRALAEAGGILGLTREPAAEPVVSLQVADLPLVGHRVLQHADEAHGYGWEWLILGLVELPRKVLSG